MPTKNIPTSQAIVDMYNKFPFPPDGWGLRAGNDFITPAIGPKPHRILDAGCGTGEVAGYLANHYKQTEIVAIDITPVSLDRARTKYEHLSNLQIEKRDITQDLSSLGRFDVVLSLGVLHHLSDPPIGLSRLDDILEPNGRVILYLYALLGRMSTERVRRLTQLLSRNDTFDTQMNVARSLRYLDPMPPMRRFRRFIKQVTGIRSETELIRDADQYLNPIVHNYTVQTLLSLVDSCGLRINRMLPHPDSLIDDEETLPLQLRDRYGTLSREARWEVLELLQRPKVFVIECQKV